MQVRCPSCQAAIEVASADDLVVRTCPHCDHPLNFSDEETITRPGLPVQSVAHFELVDHIGTGGGGSVFRAYDRKLDRQVAVKLARDNVDDQMLLREARAAAQLSHPNIVPIHEVGRDKGQVYIVSKLIDGSNLSQHAQHRDLSMRECAEICASIADALDHAHKRGVIHRDVKASNILIGTGGQPLLADFGLAKRETEATVTAQGAILGTFAYMPPEQAAGESHTVEAPADVYSLGVVLYRLMTGKLPFEGSSAMLLKQVIEDEPKAPRGIRREIPLDLENICLKAMAKRPADRYQSAADFASDLRRYLRDEPVLARRTSLPERAWRWVRRNRQLSALLASGGVIALLAIALVLRPDPPVVPAPPSGTRNVVISTTPVNARLVIRRLHPEWRQPDPREDPIRVESPARVNLSPGQYVITASVSDSEFHRVLRTVPPKEQTVAAGVLPHQRFTTDEDGRIELPTITLHDTRQATIGMALIQGGTFRMGSVTDIHHHDVPAFYIDRDEVTFGRFRRVLQEHDFLDHVAAVFPDVRDAPDDRPVSGMTWDEAVLFAELAGVELISEPQYEFAATNGGTTKYPSGPSMDLSQIIDGPVSNDQNAAGVRGLYSSMAEVTRSSAAALSIQFWPMFGETVPSRFPDQVRDSIVNSRAVRGLPPVLLMNSASEASPAENWTPAASRTVIRASDLTRHPRIGFRCTRIAVPE